MQPSNAEIVLRGFESFNSGDWDAATRNIHPDFVWVNDEETVAMTGTPLEARGPEELLEFWHAFFALWDGWRMEPGEPMEETRGECSSRSS